VWRLYDLQFKLLGLRNLVERLSRRGLELSYAFFEYAGELNRYGAGEVAHGIADLAIQLSELRQRAVLEVIKEQLGADDNIKLYEKEFHVKFDRTSTEVVYVGVVLVENNDKVYPVLIYTDLSREVWYQEPEESE
jgi:hypothetical protein